MSGVGKQLRVPSIVVIAGMLHSHSLPVFFYLSLLKKFYCSVIASFGVTCLWREFESNSYDPDLCALALSLSSYLQCRSVYQRAVKRCTRRAFAVFAAEVALLARVSTSRMATSTAVMIMRHCSL